MTRKGYQQNLKILKIENNNLKVLDNQVYTDILAQVVNAENAKVIVVGISLNFEEIKAKLEELGATIHSVDEVAAGKRIVEEVKTPQDSSARM